VVCGAFTFQGSICASLLEALPPLVLVRSSEAEPALRSVLTLLADETRREEPGQQTILDRLLDLLLVYTLRTWFASPAGTPPRWYSALDDAAVGAALRAMHGDPAHPWTVAELAALAGLSRAAFARRFHAATGTSPLAYLADWRIALAADALLRPGATLAAVAAEVGYGSEFAFSAAFKRQRGVAPGRWREQRRAQLAEPVAV
jgi:AraC-like DNA-binding protein